MHKGRALHAVVVVLALLSTFVTLASLGASLPASPFAPVEFENPTATDSNERVTVVADSQSRRLLVMDANNELRRIVNYESLNSPIDAVTDVCVTPTSIFVVGVRYLQDSDVIIQERVLRYDLFANSHTVVYQTDEDPLMLRSIVSVCDSGNDAIVGQLDYSKDQTTFLGVRAYASEGERPQKVATAPTSYVFDAGIAANEKTGAYEFTTLSRLGVIDESTSKDASETSEQTYIAVDIAADGTTIASDDITGNVFAVKDGKERKLADGCHFDSLHVNNDRFTVCDRETNLVCMYGKDGTTLDSFNAVRLSTPLATYIAVAWLCRAYLLGLLVFGVVREAHRVMRGHVHGYGAIFASTAVVLAVSIAIGYSSYDSYKRSIAVRSNEINALADYTSSISSKLSKDFERFDDRTKLRGTTEQIEEIVDALDDVDDYVGSLCDSATLNGIGMYFAAYANDDQGVYYLYDSAMEHVLGTDSIVGETRDAIEEAFESPEGNSKMYHGKSLHDETQFRLVRIPSADGSSVAGVIEMGSRSMSFEASLRNSLTEQIVTLLVILFVVYIVYVEIRECGSCLLKYRSLERKYVRDAIAVLTRPFSFLVTTLSSIDAVMSTLIAKALLQGTQYHGDGMMLALPSIMLGLGMAVGHVIYGRLGPRVELRKLMTRGAAILTVGALCATAAVGMQNFWVYCATKLAMAIPFGLLYTLEYSLPRRAETAEIRALAAGGIKRTDTSAAAFGTVLGAYAAHALGNAWVYVVMAFTSIVVLVLAMRLFPANGKPLEKERDRSVAIRTLYKNFLLSKEAIAAALLILFPATIAAGYNSFVFPLYSSDLGISNATINNVCVLGQLVVLVCIDRIDEVDAHYGKWRVSTAAVALLGLTFAMFTFNRTVGWAVAAIALVALFKKASDGWKPMWLAAAHKRKLPAGKATGAMFAVSSIDLVIRPIILGALVTAGTGTASSVLAGMCLVCALAFCLITRNTIISKV